MIDTVRFDVNELKEPAITFSVVGMVGLCFCSVLFMFALQLIGVYIGSLFYYDQAANLDIATLIMLGSNNGVVVAVSIFITSLLFTLFAFALIYIKSRHIRQMTSYDIHSSKDKWRNIWQFFGIRSIDGKGFIVSLIGMLVFMAMSELILFNLDSSPMNFLDGLIDAESLVPLLIAIVVIAPIYEELIFRGLIFGALSHQRNITNTSKSTDILMDKRTLMASVISSLLFTLVHLQYDWVGMMIIFAMALFFAFIRIKYGLIMAILMHIINNGMAMGFYLAG